MVGGITGFDIDFANGNRARAVRAPADALPGAVLAALALPPPQPRALVVLNGRTDLTAEEASALRPVLGDGLARLAVSEGFTVLTGGTENLIARSSNAAGQVFATLPVP